MPDLSLIETVWSVVKQAVPDSQGLSAIAASLSAIAAFKAVQVAKLSAKIAQDIEIRSLQRDVDKTLIASATDLMRVSALCTSAAAKFREAMAIANPHGTLAHSATSEITAILGRIQAEVDTLVKEVEVTQRMYEEDADVATVASLQVMLRKLGSIVARVGVLRERVQSLETDAVKDADRARDQRLQRELAEANRRSAHVDALHVREERSRE